MKARNNHNKHILFGMLLLTLGFSKSWFLTAEEATGQISLSSERTTDCNNPRLSRRAKADCERRGEVTRDNRRMPMTGSGSIENLEFRSRRPDRSDRRDRRDRDDERPPRRRAQAPTPAPKPAENPEKYVTKISDIAEITGPDGKKQVARDFKILDENGAEKGGGKITIKTVSNVETVIGADGKVTTTPKEQTVAEVTYNNCDKCSDQIKLSVGNVSLEDLNKNLQTLAIAQSKKQLEEKKKAEAEAERQKREQEEEDREIADRDDRVRNCESRIEGGEEVDLTTDDRYMYSSSHLSCIRNRYNEISNDPEISASEAAEMKREHFEHISEDLIAELKDADSAKELRAVLKKIKNVERRFKRDGDVNMDAKFLYRAAYSMAKMQDYSINYANNPQLRDTLIRAERQNFLSYTQRGYSSRTRELVTNWVGDVDEYVRDLTQSNSNIAQNGNINIPGANGLPGTNGINSPNFNWDDLGNRGHRFNVRNLGLNTIPQFGGRMYNSNNPVQFNNNNNNNGRIPSPNGINYSLTNGRVDLGRIPVP